MRQGVFLTSCPSDLLPQKEEKGGLLASLLPWLVHRGFENPEEARSDIPLWSPKQNLWVVPLVSEL